jgi:hypothetical protein
MTPDWQQRVWTAQVLADEQFRQALADQQIIVTNWRAVMQRFERPELLSTDSPGDVPKTHEE